MPIYEGCRLEGVRVIDVRHEQAAAHAAEAWGRMRRACGVAVVDGGPWRHRHGHGGRERLRGPGAARRRRRSTPARPGRARRTAGVRPALAVQADHEVGGSLPSTPSGFRSTSRSRSGTRCAAARPGVPRAADGHPLRRGGRRRASAPSRADARAAGDSERSRGRRPPVAAERPAMIAGTGVWWDGAAEALSALADARGDPRLPERLGPWLATSRPSSSSSSTHAASRSRRRTSSASSAPRSTSGSATGGFGARRRSSTSTLIPASSAGTASPTWHRGRLPPSSSSALAARCAPRPVATPGSQALLDRRAGVVGRAPPRDRVRQRPAQPLPPRRRARSGARAGHGRDR